MFNFFCKVKHFADFIIFSKPNQGFRRGVGVKLSNFFFFL